MNKSNKQLSHIKFGLLAFGITLSPLTLACYGSGCSSSSSSSSSHQPSTGRGVTNLTKRNKTALDRSYREDNEFRSSSDREYFVIQLMGGLDGDNPYGGEDGFLRAKTKVLEAGRSRREEKLEQLKESLKNGPKHSSTEKKIEDLEKELGKIDKELKKRADAKAKEDDEAANDENSINSVIGELQPYDITGAYLGSDPKRARDKAKELSADGDKKREDAKKLRRKADKLTKTSLSISDENQREIAKEASNRMHDKATQLENEANDLERSADDHKKSADRWEKRAAKKQKAAPKNNKATIIQKTDASSAGIPSR